MCCRTRGFTLELYTKQQKREVTVERNEENGSGGRRLHDRQPNILVILPRSMTHARLHDLGRTKDRLTLFFVISLLNELDNHHKYGFTTN